MKLLILITYEKAKGVIFLEEKRTCINCNETFPLTEEYFHKNNFKKGYYHFYTKCKICRNEQDRYNYSLRKAKKEKAIEDAWKEELRNKIFACKHCGKEKTFDEMRVSNTKKLVESICRVCYNKKHKEIYSHNYKASVFEKSLEERRNKQKEKMKNDN